MTTFNGVKVFSATMARDREVLGERVTEWLRDPAQAGVQVVDHVVRLSSDSEFHCLSVTLFFRATPAEQPRRVRRNGVAHG